MWQKIKTWFKQTFDLNRDNRVTAEDLEIARALADKKLKDANEAINEVAEAAAAVKKVTRARKKKQ